MKLNYEPFEHLGIRKPVDKISFIAANCLGKTVLDLRCYDETALSKRNTNQWLHKEISRVAKSVLGTARRLLGSRLFPCFGRIYRSIFMDLKKVWSQSRS